MRWCSNRSQQQLRLAGQVRRRRRREGRKDGVCLRDHQSWSKPALRFSKEANIVTGDNEALAHTCLRSETITFAASSILHLQHSLICFNEESFIHTRTRTHTHVHTHTHTRSVNLTCQEGNSAIRMSRSLDMNPKTVGSMQSNQVIKLIICKQLYSKTYYLPGVK